MGAEVTGTHKHKCWHCDEIWEHADSCHGDDNAHRCPNCGRYQWNKYEGETEGPPDDGF